MSEWFKNSWQIIISKLVAQLITTDKNGGHPICFYQWLFYHFKIARNNK